MGFVNDEQGQPREQDAAKIPKQRVGLLDGHDQDHGLLAGQPHVRDAPVGTAVETGDDDVAAQLRAELGLDLAPPPATPSAQDRQLAFLNAARSEEHTSELQSLMRISYAVF